jgi:hypothetical protein
MPKENIAEDNNIDRALAEAQVELFHIAQFYKRRNKTQQASEVELALARFDGRKRHTTEYDAA